MPSAIASSDAANSSGFVAEHELDVQLLADAEHRVDRCPPACTRRRRGCGRPSAPSASPARSSRARRRPRRSRAAGCRRPAATPRSARSTVGSTTTSRAELLGQRSPLRREVGGDDRADAAHLQLGDARQPDGPAAEHDRRSRCGDPALGHRVHADRERLGQRRHADGGRPSGTLIASSSLSTISSA